MHEQICDQVLHAGNVHDGAGRRAVPAVDRPMPRAATIPRRRHPIRGNQGKKKNGKSSSIDDPKFLAGYRTAYATIYDRHDYAAAIDQLKALGHDDRRRRRQSDRLLLSQARRLQGLADLVRARAAGRSEPCADLAVLRPVAARTGQPRTGAVSPEQDRLSSPAPTARNIARSPRRSKSRRAPAWSTENRSSPVCKNLAQPFGCAIFLLSANNSAIALNPFDPNPFDPNRIRPRSFRGNCNVDVWLPSALDYVSDWLAIPGGDIQQPGCIIAIAHRGEVVVESAFGHANLDSGEKLTPRHRFRIASHRRPSPPPASCACASAGS